jgi:uncharacterized membrane protein (DUF4010 family)
MTVAAAGGFAITALLAARRSLHGFLRNLTWPRLRAALVSLTMTLVALPVNPFQLGLPTIMRDHS